MQGCWRRVLLTALMVAAGGAVFATNGGGCIDAGQLALQMSSSAVDMCFIFDCQNGFLGGTISPCGDPTTAADDLFVDCPTAAAAGG